MREHPIPPVTEPMQYRAIGIVRGTYVPSDESKFTRGTLIDSEGNQIDSVVLGRVITLMRRHIEIESPHLWVVYPRSRQAHNLHLQISGIWEPSTLDKEMKPLGLISESEEESQQDELEEGDNFFSIRGELIFTKPEKSELIVRIRQRPNTQLKKGKSFKLFLQGEVPVIYLHHFVSFNVRREGQQLQLEDYEVIESLPIKKAKKTMLSLEKNN